MKLKIEKCKSYIDPEVYAILFLIDSGLADHEIASIIKSSVEYIRLIRDGKMRKKAIRQYHELKKFLKSINPKESPIIFYR